MDPFSNPAVAPARPLLRWIFLATLFVVLFANFRFNVFRTVPMEAFAVFQADSQALADQKVFEVASTGTWDPARGFLVRSKEMEKARLAGVFPAAAPEDGTIYRSQFGLQGLLISGLQRIFGQSPQRTLALAESLMAAATAGVLIWLLAGFVEARGMIFAALAVVPWLFSPTLVLAGRNLYWAIPLLMLPLAATWWIYRQRGLTPGALRLAFPAVAGLVFLKCLCGYEYITCLCLAPGLALAAIWAGNEFRGSKTFLTHASILFGAACVGFAVAIVVHVIFVWWAVGDFGQAWGAIFGRATSHIGATNVHSEVPEKYRHGLVGLVLMLIKYLTLPGVFVGAEVNLGEGTYSLITASFAGMTFFTVLLSVGRWVACGRILSTLGPATVGVLACLASLSWLIAARGHALHHFHLNSIAFLPLILALPFALLLATAPAREQNSAER
ncbi:MAG: hypothetical protein SFU53_01455 [Terrimicrobiaceae bacterium]|nr:hypothetical protein [Terrimicrobiaceae bacterium]